MTATSCRSCHSTQLHVTEVVAGGSSGSLLPVGMLQGPRYRNIICGACGLTEWYVHPDWLYLVREKLQALPVQ